MISLDKPTSFGLPFTEFRPQQIDALNRILNTQKRFVIIQAPTGVGKTLIAAMIQRVVRESIVYTCQTKQLQDQAVRDFGYTSDGRLFGATLKGKNSYPTLLYPGDWPNISPEICTAKKKGSHCKWCCSCGKTVDPASTECTVYKCPYTVAKMFATVAPFKILNLSMFLSLLNFTNFFGNPDDDNSVLPWLVCDEADELEHGLMAFIELRIGKTWAKKLEIEEPEFKTVERAWIEWVRSRALPAAQKLLSELRNGDREWMSREELLDMSWLERIIPKMKDFLSYVDPEPDENGNKKPDKWVWLSEEMVFKPVYIDKYAGDYLWNKVGRVVMMTATVISPDQLCHDLGIKREDAEFIDLPSDFPPVRRPVYYRPVVSVTHKDKDEAMPKLVFGMDQVLAIHKNDRVLVHSVSYHMTRYIAENSAHSDRMITFSGANGRIEAIERFKSIEGSILVAPALERGVNLPDDLCRGIIVPKVPWPNKKDPQVSARLYGNKYFGEMWYVTQTIRSIVQMTGRGMRHRDDWCQSYILDEQFAGLWKKHWRLFPAWWREALILPRIGG
ncbi:MAG: ATP-dependent DNA helicase [bacterium]|nr:ATP-dependent DNA helicase [bacterium]